LNGNDISWLTVTFSSELSEAGSSERRDSFKGSLNCCGSLPASTLLVFALPPLRKIFYRPNTGDSTSSDRKAASRIEKKISVMIM
jgi:hypothetical protein